ncbi:MAG: hypothetical protein K9J48_01075 [Desulfohalobiaceae bacterium]|nr:hypothetical protein [Desulfohalobiaceae bacterium]
MFCPKCNYTSFDHLPTCPKCAYDWSQQKGTFNMEWMVSTATEGMNIFTPVSPESLSQTEQYEAQSHGPAGEQSGGMFASGSHAASQESQAPAPDEEIDIEEADLMDVQGEASAPPLEEEQSAGQKAGSESAEEVDDEIDFDGLEDFSADLTEGSDTSSPENTEEGAGARDSAGGNQEPDLEIEIDEQGPETEEGAPAEETPEDEALTMDQDELDLDITSILDDIESDSEDSSSGGKKRS